MDSSLGEASDAFCREMAPRAVVVACTLHQVAVQSTVCSPNCIICLLGRKLTFVMKTLKKRKVMNKDQVAGSNPHMRCLHVKAKVCFS